MKDKVSNFRKKGSLKRTIIILLISFVLIPLSISILISIINFQNALKQTIKEDFELVSRNIKHDIISFMKLNNRIANMLSNNKVIKDYAQKGNRISEKNSYDKINIIDLDEIFSKKGNSLLTESEVIEVFDTFSNEFPSIQEIFITNKYGHNVAVSNKTSDFVQSDEKWWQEAFTYGEYTEDLEYDNSTETLVISICKVIIHPQTNEPNGVLKMSVDFTEVFDVLTTSRLGDTGETYIVNKNKYMITESRFADELRKEGYIEGDTAIFNLKVDTVGVNRALDGESGFGAYKDYRNAMIEGYYAPVEGYNWALLVEQDQAEVNLPITTFILWVIILGFIILVVAIVIAILFSNNIANPITLLTKRFIDLSKGKLVDSELKIASKNEIGLLANSFNTLVKFFMERNKLIKRVAEGDLTVKMVLASDEDEVGIALQTMVESLNRIVSQINVSVSQINQGSNQISESTQTLSTGASEQASSLEEITASISHVNEQAQQNLEYAKSSDEYAIHARDITDKGNQQMLELVMSMEKINNSSNDIKNVIKVIDDIAFQTNLLALNADIEAARVGKYGKGFAVVANSVRNLAGKSAEAVKRTSKMVDEAINNIERGNSLVDITAEQLKEIRKAIEKLRNLVEEVSNASEEQAKGVQQINVGLGQVGDVVQSNSANAEENAAASEELSAQTKKLAELTSYFKVDVDNSSDKDNRSKQLTLID